MVFELTTGHHRLKERSIIYGIVFFPNQPQKTQSSADLRHQVTGTVGGCTMVHSRQSLCYVALVYTNYGLYNLFQRIVDVVVVCFD